MNNKQIKRMIYLGVLKRETITEEEYNDLKERDDHDFEVSTYRHYDVTRYYKIKRTECTPEQVDLQFKLLMIEKVKRLEFLVIIILTLIAIPFIILLLNAIFN